MKLLLGGISSGCFRYTLFLEGFLFKTFSGGEKWEKLGFFFLGNSAGKKPEGGRKKKQQQQKKVGKVETERERHK